MQTDSRQLVNLSIGYALLLTGIAIMFICFFQVYGVFQGNPVPVKLFHFEGVKIDLAKFVPRPDTSALTDAAKKLNINIQIPQQNIEPMETEIVSGDMLNGTANLAGFIVLMSFMLSFGGKLAGIGVSLVKSK